MKIRIKLLTEYTIYGIIPIDILLQVGRQMKKDKLQKTTGSSVIPKKMNELKKADKDFITDYIRTGDGANSAVIAYSMDFPAAAVKAAIMLRDPLVLSIIDKELLANIPKTADDTAQHVWKLYRECIDKGHRIKAIELYAKLKGHLTDMVINNNYQSWNVLIANAQRQKELAEMKPIEVLDVTPSETKVETEKK